MKSARADLDAEPDLELGPNLEAVPSLDAAMDLAEGNTTEVAANRTPPSAAAVAADGAAVPAAPQTLQPVRAGEDSEATPEADADGEAVALQDQPPPPLAAASAANAEPAAPEAPRAVAVGVVSDSIRAADAGGDAVPLQDLHSAHGAQDEVSEPAAAWNAVGDAADGLAVPAAPEVLERINASILSDRMGAADADGEALTKQDLQPRLAEAVPVASPEPAALGNAVKDAAASDTAPAWLESVSIDSIGEPSASSNAATDGAAPHLLGSWPVPVTGETPGVDTVLSRAGQGNSAEPGGPTSAVQPQPEQASSLAVHSEEASNAPKRQPKSVLKAFADGLSGSAAVIDSHPAAAHQAVQPGRSLVPEQAPHVERAVEPSAKQAPQVEEAQEMAARVEPALGAAATAAKAQLEVSHVEQPSPAAEDEGLSPDVGTDAAGSGAESAERGVMSARQEQAEEAPLDLQAPTADASASGPTLQEGVSWEPAAAAAGTQHSLTDVETSAAAAASEQLEAAGSALPAATSAAADCEQLVVRTAGQLSVTAAAQPATAAASEPLEAAASQRHPAAVQAAAVQALAASKRLEAAVAAAAAQNAALLGGRPAGAAAAGQLQPDRTAADGSSSSRQLQGAHAGAQLEAAVAEAAMQNAVLLGGRPTGAMAGGKLQPGHVPAHHGSSGQVQGAQLEAAVAEAAARNRALIGAGRAGGALEAAVAAAADRNAADLRQLGTATGSSAERVAPRTGQGEKSALVLAFWVKTGLRQVPEKKLKMVNWKCSAWCPQL